MALESKSEKPPGELAALPPGDADPDDNSSAGRMSFLDHLDELRKRLVRTVLGILAGFLIAFGFIKYIFEFIMVPLQQVLPEGGKLVYTEPAEAFFLYMKIAALAGLVLATPFTLTQVWLFISPGLFKHEKRFAIPFVVFSTMFFIVGALFSHYAVFPLAWKFFAGFSTDYMEFLPKIGPVFSLYVKMLLAMGIVFQLPTLIFFLARLGLVTPKFLIKNTKYAILIIFIIAAILTPSADPVTQTAMAVPMIMLYGLSILIAHVFRKRSLDDESTK
jgi:sec-independent protein translocase protein TatC|tara:strand:- start:524 stop:1348 length:825 start_codon:yes stop_codon:yes gene_type:complete